jgi:hypothetical protein
MPGAAESSRISGSRVSGTKGRLAAGVGAPRSTQTVRTGCRLYFVNRSHGRIGCAAAPLIGDAPPASASERHGWCGGSERPSLSRFKGGRKAGGPTRSDPPAGPRRRMQRPDDLFLDSSGRSPSFSFSRIRFAKRQSRGTAWKGRAGVSLDRLELDAVLRRGYRKDDLIVLAALQDSNQTRRECIGGNVDLRDS